MLHDGQVNSDGRSPSSSVTDPHGPHRIVVFLGSSMVTSTRYMMRFASGSCSADGFYAAIFAGSKV
jgi:hypothetical protein